MSAAGLGGSRYALIVANSAYEDETLRQLRAPSRDADELARVLGAPEIGGFDVEQSRNEPAHVLRRRIARFFAERNVGDLLVLHVSGHGVKDEDGSLYFATSDTDSHQLDATAIAADFLNRQMARSRSKSIVLFLDCCFSGAFARSALARGAATVGVKENFDGQGKIVLTSSNSAEYSFEGTEVEGRGEPSYFTTAVVEGLETGAADRDGDERVSVEELYDYVYEAVRLKTPHQTPCKWTFDVRGDLFLARNPAPLVATTAMLPDPLLEALDHPMPSVREGVAADLAKLLSSRDRRLAGAARLALTELLEDDSRRVAQRAQAALEAEGAEPIAAADPAPPEPPSAPPVQPAPPVESGPPVAPPPAPVLAEPAQAAVAPPVERPADAERRTPPMIPAGILATLLAVIGAICVLVSLRMRLAGSGSGTLLHQPGLRYRYQLWFSLELIVVPAAVVIMLAIVWLRRLEPRVAASALVAFGLQTAAAGLGIIGYTKQPFGRLIARPGAVIVLGGLLWLAAGILWWRADRRQATAASRRPQATPTAAAWVCLAGAVLMLAGLVVPAEGIRRVLMNSHPNGSTGGSAWWIGLEVLVAIGVTAVVALRVLRGSTVDAVSEEAMMLAVGFQSTFFFVGFAGAWKSDNFGLNAQPGDFVGLVGALLVVGGSLLLLRAMRASPHPAPST